MIRKLSFPKALFLDLDDTILNDSGNVDDCWRVACTTHCTPSSGIDPAVVKQAIDKTREWFWSDPERHREGRLDLNSARRRIVETSLRDLGIDRPELASRIAQTFIAERGAGGPPFPKAVETVRWFRQRGCRLALLTNGSGPTQRDKIVHFGLMELFDLILIEGELGYGKPDRRVYARALAELDVAPAETWMVGDRLEWDVFPAQAFGIYGIWVDVSGAGLPSGIETRPDRIVRRLADLRELRSN
jgi:putative hydrolase of the HAD superfamily